MASDAASKLEANIVGWTPGPETRGTLSLVWSCVITIFACTWTVLHLNVPGRDERPFMIALRKAKWMVINIFFPEFILAKAVCDLRLALNELRLFDENLRSIKRTSDWYVTTTSNNIAKDHLWTWEFEYPSGWLYRLLLVKLPECLFKRASSSRWTRRLDHCIQGLGPRTRILGSHLQRLRPCMQTLDEWQQTLDMRARSLDILLNLQPNCCRIDRFGDGSHCTEAATENRRTRKRKTPVHWHTIQKWTIVHSYYAQMGGLLHPSPENPNESLDENPDKGHEPDYFCLTGSKLTSRYRWQLRQPPPLSNLILRSKDITDKSKADWLLKTIAIFQIMWLIFGVIARNATGLPITQLEIATVSFAVMAIVTYVANWWKPKDVSRAVIVPTFRRGSSKSDKFGNHMQSFTRWLWSPIQAAEEAKSIPDIRRVHNDVVWMEGDTPPIVLFMAIASLVFGALHCLAWNFDFPSRVELLCWRIASLITAILPAMTLGLSLVLTYKSIQYVELEMIATFSSNLKSLGEPNQDWWTYMSQDISTRTPPRVMVLMQTPISLRDWQGDPIKNRSKKSPKSNTRSLPSADYWEFYHELEKFREEWTQARSINPSRTRTKIRAIKLRESWFECVERLKECANDEVVGFWEGYEAFIRKEYGSSSEVPNLSTYIKRVFDAYDKTQEEAPKWDSFRRPYKRASAFLTICSGIIYAAARLATLVLLFTCLRQTPAEVYKVTPWIRFLPNIS